jgi:catechol 2,3-dioxygenase-like lactoylglutathione lyase family enzyme
VGVQRLHHVNVAVDDLAAAQAFYGEHLGLPLAERPDFGFPGLWFDLGQGQLHLVELEHAEPGVFDHFALEVDDLDSTAAALEKAGFAVDRVPHLAGAGHQGFVRDPAGNVVELNQPDH